MEKKVCGAYRTRPTDFRIASFSADLKLEIEAAARLRLALVQAT